jgi:ABC-2 type transport system ATP-binding protein
MKGIFMIELEQVSKSYDGQRKAVDSLDMVVPSGEIVGFLGPNGAGKTTTIKLITGILKADAGTIKINGEDIKEKPLDIKRQIGFVPDNPDMFLRLKGLEYLNFMADMYQVEAGMRRARIAELAEKFEMQDALGDRMQNYSHGMRQKIVLIGALLHDPAVWILDEPLTGLDPRASFVLKETLRHHAEQGKTVFFSTHVLDVAEKFCDQVAIIHKGKKLFQGKISAMQEHVASNESLEKMFLEMTE